MVENLLAGIIQEINSLYPEIDSNQMEVAAEKIAAAPKVFTAGAGRAGSMMDCFAKRLMHADINAFVLGETITPPASKGDLLVIGSGSGATESLVVLAGKAKKLGVDVCLITTNPNSAIAALADLIIVIPAGTPKSADANAGFKSIQPMANLFEQMLHLVTDALSIRIAQFKNMDYDSMFARHANLE